LSNRSQSKSIVGTLTTRNPALWSVVASALLGLAVVLYLPAARRIFLFTAPSAWDVALAALAGGAGIVASELLKLALRFGRFASYFS
jgi:hypothetical protein